MTTVLFPFEHYAWLYASFLALVGALLVLDLGVFHRKAHVVTFKEAACWSVFWIGLSLVCNWGFYQYALHKFQTDPRYLSLPGFSPELEASRVGLEFLTGFVIEKTLAIDNIFIFVMVFSAFKVPAIYQHRVLFLGILGAIFFRTIFIAAGSQLMNYHWVVVFFGALLIATGVKMLFPKKTSHSLEESWSIRLAKRVFRLTNVYDGQKFLTRKNGLLYGTPLLLALIFIEVSDIVFAIDSVPAIFALTKEPMIVFISNILAILGMRSLYFMLAGVVDRFVYLKVGLSGVLVFVGLKMVWLNEAMGGKFPISWSLGIIGAILFASIAASLLVTRKNSLPESDEVTTPTLPFPLASSDSAANSGLGTLKTIRTKISSIKPTERRAL